MAYHIELRARARHALERLAEQMTPEIYDGLWDAVDSLAELPERCTLVPEPKLRAKRVRHLLYGSGRGVYRILYRVRDERVEILTIRPRLPETIGIIPKGYRTSQLNMPGKATRVP